LGIYPFEGVDLSAYVTLSNDPGQTEFGTSNINLTDNLSLSSADLQLAHEMNNALNSDQDVQLGQEIKAGTLSEPAFAQACGQIEMNGVICQALVAGELNIPYPLPGPMALQLQNYQAGAISLQYLQNWAYTNFGSQMVLANNPNETANSYYNGLYYRLQSGNH
jgi:hypothetical protein